MAKTFERILIEQCAPTLARIKTGSLFSYPVRECEDISQSVKYWNQLMVPRGVVITVLAKLKRRILLYVYRKKSLVRDLKDPEVSAFLHSIGYTAASADEYISLLRKRFTGGGRFPHEIGLFLGYPLHDVVGFIENLGKNYNCCGCWKVYGDHRAAQRCFAQFKKCRSVYLELFIRGKSILQLTVSV